MSIGTNIQTINFNRSVQQNGPIRFKGQIHPVKDYPPDTVEISEQNKTEKAERKKLGVGLCIIGAALLAVGILSKGRLSKAKDVVKQVEFKEAKTFEEAKKYAYDNLGVVYHDIDDLEMANFINEWLTNVHNKCKTVDKSSYPRVIANAKGKQITAPFCMTSGAKFNNNIEGHVLGVNMSAFNNFDKFLEDAIGGTETVLTKNDKGKYIVVDHAFKTDFINNVIDRVNNYSNKMTLKEKIKLMSDMQKIENGSMVDGKWKEKELSIFQMLNHELGHLRHQYLTKDYENMKKVSEFQAQGEPISDITQEFLNNKEIQEIAGKVSPYAQESPLEFVAETFADLMEGKTLPDDVMALYKKYNGPMVN